MSEDRQSVVKAMELLTLFMMIMIGFCQIKTSIDLERCMKNCGPLISVEANEHVCQCTK